MITNQDRGWWFGASDTSFVVGNWTTDTFAKWWTGKLGYDRPKFNTKYTLAGTYYEHAILDTIPLVEKDKQIRIPQLSLRVNFDGNVGIVIYEVKTYKAENEFKVTKGYWRQAQVEMFAMKSRELYIVSYPLTEEHYRNYFLPIDKNLLRLEPVEYDEDFINNEYLPKLKYLGSCMKIGSFPRIEEFNEKNIQ